MPTVDVRLNNIKIQLTHNLIMNKFFQLTILSSAIVLSATANHAQPKQAGIPLRTGTYYEAGSKYITIFGAKGNFCYWGGSANGTTMASLRRDPQNPNVYKVYKFGNASIMQKSPNVLLFDGREFTFDGGGNNSKLSAEERACLRGKGKYTKTSTVGIYGKDSRRK
jgi:hypothetical protein